MDSYHLPSSFYILDLNVIALRLFELFAPLVRAKNAIQSSASFFDDSKRIRREKRDSIS